MERLAAVDWFTIIAALCFWAALVWTQHLDRSFPVWLRRSAWPCLALWLVAWNFSEGPGLVMALAAAPAFLFALWLWAHGLRRFLADDLTPAPRRLLEMLAATGPLVAAAAWVWSRYDRTFAGFPDPLATLTTVHFAITFGVLPLAMAASERPLARSRARDLGIWLYVVGAPATALCFALRSNPLQPGLVEVAAAVVFAAGFLLWAAFMPLKRGPWPYACLVPGFLLGVGYTAAHAFGWSYLTIPQMAAVHGSLNLLGVLLLAAQAPAFDDAAAPAPDLLTPVEGGDRATAVFADTHRVVVGVWSPEAFARVKEALLGYRFYPEHVMVRRTQFEDEGRAVRVGDRLGLGLFVPNLPGLAPLMLPAVVEVDVVEAGAERVELGYVTTRRHYGRGIWRAEVKREGESLVLTVSYHVRPSRWFVWCGLPVYRRFQLAAFRAGADNLRRLAA
ncbi:MAG: YndJ-like protein [Verrucomicrobiota bacterium]|jgi:hypothetical protein